jgi:hypothetical protein
MTVRNLRSIACVLSTAFSMIVPTLSMAEPRYSAEVEGVKITLHDDKCALPAVANLARKATWEERGKTFDGCWGGAPSVPGAHLLLRG